MKLLIIHIISISLCFAVRYDCDEKNLACGCAFKYADINEANNYPEEAIPYSWSMMVSIRHDCNRNGNTSTHCCAGTILNNRYILTAARCFDPVDNTSLLAGNITIAAGIHSLTQNCQTIRVVEDIFIHPNWTTADETLHNIAILRLAEPLDFRTDFILSSACLPDRRNTSIEIIPNTTLVTVGWNSLSTLEDNIDQVLRQLIVYRNDDNDSLCTTTVNNREWLFCAERQGATCFPEVGGSLFQWMRNRWELVGIASYDMNNCSEGGQQGLFVRVASYSSWIESILNADITPTTDSITTQSSIGPKPPTLYECNRGMPCGCGYSDVVFRSTRIIGGEDVVEHSWSMIVSLRFYGTEEHSCAGTLISSSYVLTAAHCVDHFSSSNQLNITIVAGITNRSDSDNHQRNIDRMYIHENYTGWPYFVNNIALLHMNRPLYFQNNPVLAKTCVPNINFSLSSNDQYLHNETRLVVIGWGAMRPGSVIFSDYLQQIQINAIDDQEQICKNAISDSELQFCAGVYNSEKDACIGDSGGPVLRWTGHYWEQVGLTGYNFHCGRPGHPGIYTRLINYWQWMEDILLRNNEHLEPPVSFSLPTTTVSTRPTVGNTTRIQPTTYLPTGSPSATTAFIVSSSQSTSPPPTSIFVTSLLPTSSHVATSSVTTARIPSPSATSAFVTPPSPTSAFVTPPSPTSAFVTPPSPTSARISSPSATSAFVTPPSPTSAFVTPPSATSAFVTPPSPTTASVTPPSATSAFVTPPSPTSASVTPPSATSAFATPPSPTTASVTPPSLTSAFVTPPSATSAFVTPPSPTSARISSPSATSAFVTPPSPTSARISSPSATSAFVTPPSPTSARISSPSATSAFVTPPSSTIYTPSNVSSVIITTKGMIQITSVSQRTIITSTSQTQITTADLRTTAAATTSLPQITTTTTVPINKVTYECKRIPDECGCSLSNVVLSNGNQQISPINGANEDAYPYSWSMIVSIRVNGIKHTCTGTILSDTFILTTAQCVFTSLTSHSITVAAGIHSLSQYVPSIRTVAQVHIHENYKNNTMHLHDIAILRLQQPLELKTQPLFSKTCLPNSQSFLSIENAKMVSVGWKHSAVEENILNSLQQVSIKTIYNSNLICFNSTYDVTYQLCAGLINNRTDSCKKNFGEPLFVYRNEYWEQVGMLSKPYYCNSIGHSGVFTLLTEYTDWIQRIMENTKIPIRPISDKNNASNSKQKMFQLNILLFTMTIFCGYSNL